MASPQKENGNTGIANELLEQICKFRFFSASPLKIWLFVARKTYGFQKSTDHLSLSQIMNGTSLSRQTVNDSLKWLVKACLLVKGSFSQKGTVYGINKDYEQWVVNTHRLVKTRQLGSLPALTHNKNNYNKNYIEANASNKNKPMYKEPIIELDVNGNELEQSTPFKLPKDFIASISRYYSQKFNVPPIKGVFFGHKPVIEAMIELIQKWDHCKNNPVKIKEELQMAITIAKKKCEKEGWKKMKLSTILENFNNLKKWKQQLGL